jgi:hypothetical protein
MKRQSILPEVLTSILPIARFALRGNLFVRTCSTYKPATSVIAVIEGLGLLGVRSTLEPAARFGHAIFRNATEPLEGTSKDTRGVGSGI